MSSSTSSSSRSENHAGDYEQRLMDKISTNPNMLLEIVKSILHTFRDAEALVEVDADKSRLLMRRAMNQIFVTNTIIPTIIRDASRRDNITAHLDSISKQCKASLTAAAEVTTPQQQQGNPTTLQSAHPKEAPWWWDQPHAGDAVLEPWIVDWNDPTLQDAAVKELVKEIAIPTLFPELRRTPSIRLTGHAKCGKTHALDRIYAYLKQKGARVEWTCMNCLQFEDFAQQTLKALSRPLCQSKQVLVVERVPGKVLDGWKASAWWEPWCAHVQRTRGLIWVLVSKEAAEGGAPDADFDVAIDVPKPSAKTIYNIHKQEICKRYNKATRIPFARLPVLDESAKLAEIAESLESRGANVADVLKCLHAAIDTCASLAAHENVVCSVGGAGGGVWFPRCSFVPERMPKRAEYRLISSLRTKTHITVPPDAVWWNIQLDHTTASCEMDRIAQAYTPGIEKEGLVAEVPIRARRYPACMDGGMLECHEALVAMHFSLVRQTVQQQRRLFHGELLQAGGGYGYEQSGGGAANDACDSIMSLEQLAKITREQEARWFSRAVDVTKLSRKLCSHFVLSVLSDAQDSARLFHLRCGKRSTRKSLDGDGMLAEDLCRQVCYVTQSEFQVTQVQTTTGYDYYIDFVGDASKLPAFTLHLDTECKGVSLLPRVNVIEGGGDLDGTYCLTNESDVDLLTDRFPSDYKDVYRDDEATWKGQPVRDPSHLAYLNDKYSREIKFYLRLCSSLMRLKLNHFAALNARARTALTALLSNIQNYLDFALMIVPEHEEDGQWSKLWQMSKNHRQYEQYHPPSHSDTEAVVRTDLTQRWQKHGVDFHVPPQHMRLLLDICGSESESESDSEDSIRRVFNSWKRAQQLHAAKETSTMSVLIHSPTFAASKGTHTREWSKAMAVSHFLRTKEDVVRCLTESRRMATYLERYEHTLMRAVFEADDIQLGIAATGQPTTHWYSLQAGASKALSDVQRALKHQPDTWGLLAESTCDADELQWLFAIVAGLSRCGDHHMLALRHVLPHLLMFREFGYWEDTVIPCETPAAVVRILNRCESLGLLTVPSTKETWMTFVSDTKDGGASDAQPELKTLDNESMTRIAVLGLRSHHILDSIMQ